MLQRHVNLKFDFMISFLCFSVVLIVLRFHSVLFIISDCFLVVLLGTHHTKDQGDGGNQCDPYYVDGLKPQHCELVCNALSI